ncbi:phage major tail tube protein [Escherichia coli]|uniref:phage major tail tube protein n=1 Tax=Escherichia coli TaxID=562 RepID=UPI003CFCB3B6
MASALPRQLKNFNLYLDGGSYAGRADTITLPELNFVRESHRAGGMDGPRSIEMGMELLTASMVISDADPRMIALMGRDDIPIVARGSVQEQGKAPEPVIVNMRGLFAGLSFGQWQPGTKSTQTLTAELGYFRYRQKDQEYCEIDILNMIRKFDGIDQLAAHRDNIGI